MENIIHLVLDYASGDLAQAEVVSAISAETNIGYKIHTSSINSFDTISNGFVTAQLANFSHENANVIVFSNCAPRKDSSDPRANNDGEGLVYAILNNESRVFSVNSGHSLSFIKDDIKFLYSVNFESTGSQFRSRDNFPKIIGKYIKGDRSFIGEQLQVNDVIPDIPCCSIGYIDSFGNLKTTIRDDDDILKNINAGQRLSISINDVTMLATVSTGSFNVQEGDIAFAPGSSGNDRKYWEIFQRGASAWRTYKKPSTGSKVEISFC